MKKLLGIVVLGLLLSGNGYAEIITFSKCAHERHDFKFQSNIYKKSMRIIDTDKKIISSTTIFTDEHFKKIFERNSEERQYYFGETKIDTFNEYIVKTKRETKINNIVDIAEHIYDLEEKKIQITSSLYRDGNHQYTEISFIQCQ